MNHDCFAAAAAKMQRWPLQEEETFFLDVCLFVCLSVWPVSLQKWQRRHADAPAASRLAQVALPQVCVCVCDTAVPTTTTTSNDLLASGAAKLVT